MGIILTHRQISLVGVPLSPLVAPYNPRRNADRAQQKSECARVVATEPLPGFEQKLVDGIALQSRRRQRI